MTCAAVKDCVERYRQPALVEEYIAGREFTVGLLGDKRPRVLPPMEIKFKKNDPRPVYDYTGQAGLGRVRLLRVPGEADRGRAEGDGGRSRARRSGRLIAVTSLASTLRMDAEAASTCSR